VTQEYGTPLNSCTQMARVQEALSVLVEIKMAHRYGFITFAWGTAYTLHACIERTIEGNEHLATTRIDTLVSSRTSAAASTLRLLLRDFRSGRGSSGSSLKSSSIRGEEIRRNDK